MNEVDARTDRSADDDKYLGVCVSEQTFHQEILLQMNPEIWSKSVGIRDVFRLMRLLT